MLALITKALIAMCIILFYITVMGIATKEKEISIATGLLTLFIVSILVAMHGHGKGRFVGPVLIGVPTLIAILITVIEIKKEIREEKIEEQKIKQKKLKEEKERIRKQLEEEREKIRKQRVLNRIRRIQETMDRENKWIEIMEEIDKEWKAKMKKIR